MDARIRVVALIAAYNEADIIERVVRSLIDQGIMVYLLDDGSTDGTADVVEPYRGEGVIDIERRPRRDPHSKTQRFDWTTILQRKQSLAAELDAHWFIHHDADEFRESPWSHLDLAAAIEAVDSLGYNAIDFKVFNFWPTHNGFRRGDDPREEFQHYAPGEGFDRVQIRCWKKTASVDLTSSGGHDALFPGRRVFPIRFLLRHYPIRSQEHGERKVFSERQPSFLQAEREQGWHIQYDHIRPGHSFIRNPSLMIFFEPEAARMQVLIEHRDVEELAGRLANTEHEASCARDELASALEELVTSRLEFQLLSARVDAANSDLDRTLDFNRELNTQLNAARRHVDALLSSASWRWTSWLRGAKRIAMKMRR